MAFDGNFTSLIVNELAVAVDAHLDKIYQPSNDEICLQFRKKGFVKRLLISVKNGMQRVHFSEMKLENPEKPPMFCMLFRKYFSSARLISVTQKGFERLVEFTFETTNEMGDRVNLRLVAELIGNSSNVILVDENGKIIDALRRSDILSGKRLIQPGARYEYPPAQDKIDICTESTDKIFEKLKDKNEIPISKALLDTIGGISPLVSREIIYKSGILDSVTAEIKDINNIKTQIEEYKTALLNGGTPFMLKKDGVPFEFSYLDISQYGSLYEKETFESYSELLDAFYLEKGKSSQNERITGEVKKLVNNCLERANKRLTNRTKELEDTKTREELRIKGELIKANIGIIKTGQTSVTVQNFYDENLSDIKIKLDPALNPQNNAARYFKEYKKKSVAANTLNGLIEKDKKEIDYLSSVLYSLSVCESASELSEIRSELKLAGYIKQNPKEKKQKEKASSFLEYKSIEGYTILVGKNNIQNDTITTKLASKNDVWFHTKNIHGSHVVVFSGGKPISEETVIFAATLAAKNSKASSSSNVPVDYTPVKYVKKPAGANFGMVIYTTNKTVYVTP